MIKYGAAVVAAVALLIAVLTAVDLRSENRRLRSNQELLMQDREEALAQMRRYKVSDSLNAMSASQLRFTLAEYKRYRATDLALVNELKSRKDDLERVVATQLSAIEDLRALLRDTVTPSGDTVRCFDYVSEWTDVRGCLSGDTVSLEMEHRESLKVVETVQRKRFLGFLWKTNKVKSRRVDVVSSNPHTTVVGVDYVGIER